uniref:Uncharacterized protein n=1 Tax=Rhizophora mucronata TaxID=61149 RepID=A0A2P2PDM4_RHIMU
MVNRSANLYDIHKHILQMYTISQKTCLKNDIRCNKGKLT